MLTSARVRVGFRPAYSGVELEMSFQDCWLRCRNAPTSRLLRTGNSWTEIRAQLLQFRIVTTPFSLVAIPQAGLWGQASRSSPRARPDTLVSISRCIGWPTVHRRRREPRIANRIILSQHTQRVHPGVAGGTIQKAQASGNRRMPIRKPSGEEGRTLGRGPYSGEDEGIPVAEAAARGAI
jgi:hypothetical protein